MTSHTAWELLKQTARAERAAAAAAAIGAGYDPEDGAVMADCATAIIDHVRQSRAAVADQVKGDLLTMLNGGDAGKN